MQTRHINLRTLVDEAAAVWTANPHLAFCHADKGEFIQSYLQSHRQSLDETSATYRSMDETDEERRALALARLNLLRSPYGSSEKQKPFERTGARLVFWCYGPIGREGLTADDICKALDEHKDAGSLYIRIATSGGYADDALRISQAIHDHPAKSIAVIDRYAYSAGSAIACAANRVLIRKSAMWMAHQSVNIHAGNADDLMNHARNLRGMDQRIAGTYARRRQVNAPTMYALIQAGRYLTAEEAVDIGVCDRVIPDLAINWDQPTQ